MRYIVKLEELSAEALEKLETILQGLCMESTPASVLVSAGGPADEKSFAGDADDEVLSVRARHPR